MTEGIVYVLTNPAMPGIVKIGKTTRGVSARLNELYSTGVPLPFRCAYAARVEDESKVERAFHQAFGPDRINPRREFFDIEPVPPPTKAPPPSDQIFEHLLRVALLAKCCRLVCMCGDILTKVAHGLGFYVCLSRDIYSFCRLTESASTTLYTKMKESYSE